MSNNTWNDRLIKDTVNTNKEIPFDQCRSEALNFITAKRVSNAGYAAALTAEEMHDQIKGYLSEFISANSDIVVEGFYDAETLRPNMKRLTSELEASLLDWGPLAAARVDEDITEIQIVARDCIWAEKNGKFSILKDPLTGKHVAFSDNMSVVEFANKLLAFSKKSTSLTADLTCQRGITVEGYRISVVGPGGISAQHGMAGGTIKCPSITIRKFSKVNLSIADLVRFKSVTVEMARLLMALPRYDQSALCIGATGGGKTAGLQTVQDSMLNNMRNYIIEETSEINARKYNAAGEQVNNVVQCQIIPYLGSGDPPASWPTCANHIATALTSTPHYLTFGELKLPVEFMMVQSAANTGHVYYGTSHSFSTLQMIYRMVNEIQKGMPGVAESQILRDVCNGIAFGIVYAKLPDGHRKITNIDEVIGTKWENGILVPDINPIFEYRPERGVNPDGSRKGRHWQIGTISKNRQTFMLNFDECDELLDEITVDASPDAPIEGSYNQDELARIKTLFRRDVE